MKKLEIIIQPEKLEALKAILDASNVSGIMISNIMGYGNQKGHKQFYRGAEYSVNLLPKIKVETVVEPEIAEPLIRKGLSDLIAGGMDATAATELLLNVVWTIVSATLVYFMQAGFAMCEAGFTRAKNTGNILMKNMMDFVLGSLFFFIFGFAIMHGTDWNGIIGIKGFFNPTTLADADGLFNGLPIGVFLIFHTVFCATSATIVSGSMAERTKFLAYLLYSATISIFIYPVTGHWIWGGGWLAQMGFHDFAGSTAVHMVGGICALVVTWIRYGKPDVSMTFNGSLAGLVAITGGWLVLLISFYHFLFFSTIADFLPIISEIFPSFTIYSSNSPIYPSS